MITMLRMSCFILSNLGIWELIHKHSKIHLYFIPGLTIAIQITFLFFGGILNVLPETSFTLFVFGLLALLWSICTKRIQLNKYLQPGFIFLSGAFLFSAFILRGKLLTHVDNFTHWGTIIKTMLSVDRFPTFQDPIIKFQEYPLGSSSYIYFFSKWVGNKESIWMLAQTYMMLVSFLPLFLFDKKNRKSTILIVTIVSCAILCYNVRITDLLVDTLLPLVGVSGLIYAYFNCSKNQTIGKELFFVTFYLIAIIQIKNSGIFFVIIICIYVLTNMKMEKKDIILRIVCVVLPCISFFLWHKHCEYVFTTAKMSAHAMTADRLASVFNGKTTDDIRNISNLMFNYLLTCLDTWIVLGLMVLVNGFAFVISKELGKKYVRFNLFLVAIFLSYCAGLLGTYLFSMSMESAMRLAAITRYIKTIFITLIYLVTVLLIKQLSENKLWEKLNSLSNPTRNKSRTIFITYILLFFSSLIVLFFISCNGANYTLQPSYYLSRRVKMEAVKHDYNIPERKSYDVLISPNDKTRNTGFLTKYTFYADKVNAFLVETKEDLGRITAQYVIIQDLKNSIIIDWIKENYPEQIGNSVIVRE